jgi:hypothetical protein
MNRLASVLCLSLLAALSSGCPAVVAGGAALGANESDHDEAGNVEVAQRTDADGRPECKITCTHKPKFCAHKAAAMCGTWTGDPDPQDVPSGEAKNPLIGTWKMVVRCQPPVKTEDVCQ